VVVFSFNNRTDKTNLLFKVCDNIAPSLSLTEASGSDYASRIIPLALSDEAVQNSFLTASASHARATRAAYRTTDILNYRSAAIKGLRKKSAEIAETFDGAGTAVFILATILGLLIDDMINSSKEYPILIKLVDSWMRMYRCSIQKQEESLIKFLLDQIQMYASLLLTMKMLTRLTQLTGLKHLCIHFMSLMNCKNQPRRSITC
jgi:hypothetical protein